MKNFKAMGAARASKQRGFTIIELVVVILLLGILTATALPRFLDISTEAHDAVVNGTLGGLRTGVALYRANWNALSQTTSAISNYGSNVPNSSGYPAGTSGTGNTVDSHTDCKSIFDGLLQVGAPTTITGTYTGFTDDGTADPSVDDTDLASVNGSADFLAVFTSTSNCTYYYIGDPQRTTSTAPQLTYVATTGVVARVN